MNIECKICGMEVMTENPGASIINGKWVHNRCIIGNETNLKYMLNEEGA